MRDLAIVNQLQNMAEVQVDWLAPDPAGSFLADRGCRVLVCSAQLAGSGKAYAKVFENCTDEFNLLNYLRVDTKLHRHDFDISRQAWNSQAYDVIVGDEAFWLLSGFGSKWGHKPAPFVFLTDFIGVKAMRPRMGDLLTAWRSNLQFSMSHWGPDVYLYIGDAAEIPDERFGFRLPSRRKWAEKHCRFVKPVVNFNPNSFPDKRVLRKQLDLREDGRLFVAVDGPAGNRIHRTSQIEQTFELLKLDFPNAQFMLIGPETGDKSWIQYHHFLDKLYAYFAAADCVLTQSGYGKAVELAALGTPFIAIPLDYHFEQEYVMAHRLKHYGIGKMMTLRDHSPQEIAQHVKTSLNGRGRQLPVDMGTEIGRIILETVQSNQV